MYLRRKSLAALLLALLGQFCLSGAVARAFDHGRETALPPLLRELPRRDLFGDELRKRQTAESRVALCPDAPSLAKKSPGGRAGNGECARNPNEKTAFPRSAEQRPSFFPPGDAGVPGTIRLAPPPSRSPPSR